MERVNQIIEVYLYYYINYKQNNQVELLPLIQYTYNSIELKGIGIILFFANYKYILVAYKSLLINSAHA